MNSRFRKYLESGLNVILVPVFLVFPIFLSLVLGFSPLIALDVYTAFPLDLQFELFGEGIDNRNAHSVKPAGNLIGFLVELASGMKEWS